MKLMTPTTVLDFVDGLSPADIVQTRRHLAGLGSEESLDKLLSGYYRGTFFATTTTRDGKNLYRYLWHISDDNYLHVNASLYVGQPGEGDDWLWLMGAQFIARAQGCRGIRFETLRKGHAVQALRKGFKVTGIEMQQDFENVPVPV